MATPALQRVLSACTGVTPIMWLLGLAYLGQMALSGFANVGFGLTGVSSIDAWAAGAVGHESVLDSGDVWRLASTCWLHGSILHLVMNALAIVQLGRFCEVVFGRMRFTFAYLVCGIGSSVGVVGWNWFTATFLPLGSFLRSSPEGFAVGASGALCGLLGMLISHLRQHPNPGAQRIVRSLTLNAVFILFLGIVVPIISNTAHVCGFATGWVIGLFLQGSASPVQWSGSTTRSRRLAMATVVLMVVHLASIGFAAGGAPTRKSEYDAGDRVLGILVDAHGDLGAGWTPDQVASRRRILKELDLPADLASVRDRMLPAFEDGRISTAEAARLQRLEQSLLSSLNARIPEFFTSTS